METKAQEQDDIIFHSQSLGKLRFDQVIEEIVRFIQREPDKSYRISIGTDSHASDISSLVSAVTVWRVGNGAVYFWTKSPEKRFGSMDHRIFEEAIASIMLAQEMRDRLRKALNDDFFWQRQDICNEIHVDMGRKGKTNKLVDKVIGMIRGYEFTPVIKPDAYTASAVADRHT